MLIFAEVSEIVTMRHRAKHQTKQRKTRRQINTKPGNKKKSRVYTRTDRQTDSQIYTDLDKNISSSAAAQMNLR